MTARSLQFVLGISISRFSTNVKRAAADMNALTRATRRVDRTFAGAIAIGQRFRAELDRLNGSANHVRTAILGLAGAAAGGAALGAAARAAFGFNQTIEQSRIGIAALVRTFQGVDMETSFKTAAEIQQRLQIAGLKTTATYEELLTALQEGIGPALRENFDPAQIVAFTSSMTQAAAALSLPMDQLGQELRAILDGTIDRNARIATALQLDSATIKEWKKAGTLFDNLQDKLRAFAAAGDQASNTFGGAFSNLQDAIQMAFGRGTQKTFSSTAAAIQRVTAAIVTIDEAAGTFRFNDKITSAFEEMDDALANFLDTLTTEDIANAAANFSRAMTAVARGMVDFGRLLASAVDALGPFAPAIAWATGQALLLSTAMKTLGFVLLEPYRLMRGITAALGPLVSGLASAASGTSMLAASLRGGIYIAAAAAVVKIGQLVAILHDWRRASLELADARAALRSQEDWVSAKAADKLREINQALGTTYRTMDDLFAAEKRGEVVYDDLAGTWVRGAKEMTEATRQQAETAKRVTGEALDEMRKQYEAYIDQVRRLQDEITGRQRSLLLISAGWRNLVRPRPGPGLVIIRTGFSILTPHSLTATVNRCESSASSLFTVDGAACRSLLSRYPATRAGETSRIFSRPNSPASLLAMLSSRNCVLTAFLALTVSMYRSKASFMAGFSGSFPSGSSPARSRSSMSSAHLTASLCRGNDALTRRPRTFTCAYQVVLHLPFLFQICHKILGIFLGILPQSGPKKRFGLQNLHKPHESQTALTS